MAELSLGCMTHPSPPKRMNDSGKKIKMVKGKSIYIYRNAGFFQGFCRDEDGMRMVKIPEEMALFPIFFGWKKDSTLRCHQTWQIQNLWTDYVMFQSKTSGISHGHRNAENRKRAVSKNGKK